MDHKERFEQDRRLVEEHLSACFADRPRYGQIYEAMRYSLLAGGKRLRPILTIETCRLFGGSAEAALPFGCAVEMVHTYSLIHDDLPCMDDDDLRRGKPTNHKVFGEATAVLAGDALLTAAFETMCEHRDAVGDARALAAMDILSHASGAGGMVGGQVLDMEGENKRLTVPELELLQSLKTGALIGAAVEIGAVLAGADDAQRAAVRRYAMCLGRAFQIEDDLLDVSGDPALLGKPVGSDEQNGKSTFVTALGAVRCRELIRELTDRAVTAVSPFDPKGFHVWLARSLEKRDH